MQNSVVFGIIRFLSLPVMLIITIAFVFIFAYFRIISEALFFCLSILLLIAEVLVWFLFLLKETWKLNKRTEKVKRNINIGILAFYMITPMGVYSHLSKGEFEYAENSPCGKYSIEVYTHPHILAMPGGGGFGSRSTTVVLKNKWGWKIGRSDSSIYDELEIKWDYINKCVWVSRGNAIDF